MISLVIQNLQVLHVSWQVAAEVDGPIMHGVGKNMKEEVMAAGLLHTVKYPT